jgi:hypothetical protein
MSTQDSIFCKNCVLKEMINVQYIKLGLHFLSYFFLMDMFLYSLPWGQASESDGKVSLPVMCQAVCIAQPQPYRQCATYQAWYDHVGVTAVENLTSRVFPFR